MKYTFLLLLAVVSCDVIRAQFEFGRVRGGAEEEGAEVDYYYHDSQRRSDDESEVKSTPDDPDGDGVVGRAGKDYPVLRRPPKNTAFTCHDKIPGIYADMDTGCQVYHICQSDERMESSICVNGTVFNQESLACDWWYNVDCSATQRFYWVNTKLGKQAGTKRVPVPDFEEIPSFRSHQAPSTSFSIDFPPIPLKKAPLPSGVKKQPSPPVLKKMKDKFRPLNDVVHYGREAFDPALNVPPRPKNSEKKFGKQNKQSSFSMGKSSPMTLPVNSDDVIAGYSDLYLNKPVDED